MRSQTFIWIVLTLTVLNAANMMFLLCNTLYYLLTDFIDFNTTYVFEYDTAYLLISSLIGVTIVYAYDKSL